MNINEIVTNYGEYFNRYLQIMLAELPAKMCPALRFSEGDECYTDKRIINIGKKFITKGKKDIDEDEAVLTALYIIGHEGQHVLSSPDKYWSWGIEHGAEVLASEMCFCLNGYRLKGEDDVKAFCKDAQNKGYGVSYSALKKLTHHILNSVEDGRIERIRCKNSSIFRDQMFLYRIRHWQENHADNAGHDFLVVLNQILCLATMGMYEQGFLEKFANTPVAELVERLMPYIGAGVKARSCYDCALQTMSIYKILAPMCLEYFKGNKNAESQLNNNAVSRGQNGNGECNSYPNTADNEMYSDGSMGDAGQKTDKANSSKNDKSSVSAETGKKSASDENSSENAPANAKGRENADRNGGNKSGNTPMESVFSELMKNKGLDKVEGVDSAEVAKDVIEAALERLKEQAMENCRENLNSVKNMGVRKAPVIKEVFDNSAPVTRDILKGKRATTKFNFLEKKQKYNVFLPMPQILRQRAEAFADKLKTVFERENIPETTERLSGSVNTNDLYKLAIGELDFWKRNEEEGEIDACAYFLCDNSGSMGHGEESKREYALSSLAIIEEGFKRYMPLKIVAFQESGRSVVHDVVKNWEEIRANSCSYNFLAQGPGGSSNADGLSIRIATQELLDRPESQKILFVLSDGLPAYSNGEADTAIAAEEARDTGIILVPIYFGSCACSMEATLNSKEAHTFANMYQKNYIITVPEKIEENVINVLTRLVMEQI